MATLKSVFKEVKEQEWEKAIVSFYIAKRYLDKHKAHYSIHQVNADNDLRKKLRKVAVNCVSKANNVREYDHITADLDGDVLGLKSEDTDFQGLIGIIMGSEAPEFVADKKDLLGAWMYIARLDLPELPPLFAARRVSSMWTTKKVRQAINMVFKGNMLFDLDQQELFRVDGKIDFYSYSGIVFVADKSSFETAMNFRAGMERNRDEIVEDFKKHKIFDDAENVGRLVGDNLRRLRKLSQVKKSGYFKDSNFIQRLINVSEEDGWGLEFTDEGKLKVDEDNIDLVLRVLNNDRLTSKINEEDFDVDVKHPV